MQPPLLLPLLLPALALGAFGASASPSLSSQLSTLSSSVLRSTVLPTPAPATSHCANLTTAPDGTVHLTYYGPAPSPSPTSPPSPSSSEISNLKSEIPPPPPAPRTLWHATLTPGATAFSAPRSIVTTPLLMENWADFASLAVGTDGALTAQWFQKSAPAAGGYDGWYSRSDDGGRTWRAPARLGHEFVALAPLSSGHTLAVWLESWGRGAPAASDHAHGGMKLLARLLAPDGATLGEWTVDPDVCTCCQNTVAVLPGDRVFAAYRGHTADEIRDNKFSTFDLATHTWSAPATLRDDGWKIPACPVNGPAADARGPALAVAWFTAANGIARVHASYSANSARTFTAPVTVDLGRPLGRLETIMLADQTAVLFWLESKTDTTSAGIYARRLWPDGTLSAAHLVADSTQARSSGFPRAALRPTGRIVLSYTQPGETTQVRLLELDPTTLTRPASASLTAAPPPASNPFSNLKSEISNPTSARPPIPLEFCIAPTLASH